NIKNIFKDVREIDKTIIPAIKTESNNIREKLKKHKESSKVNQKYGFDMMEKTTKDNFGIFFDQKQ
ncbi:MAG: flagellar protein FliT, partial [Peptostreptococcaceae bacterium]|nr:flagellar protein FliT [Peptostreptococcaceae bacterium]